MQSPARSSWRWPGAALVTVTAAVHVPLVSAHLREAPYTGVLFIALIAGCLATAVALILRDGTVVWAAAGTFASLAVAAYVLSRSVGLPSLGDDIGHWTEPLGVLALTSETITALLACDMLRGGRERRVRRHGW